MPYGCSPPVYWNQRAVSRAGVPTGGSVCYMDTKGALPGFVEIIELGPVMESTFAAFYGASLGWDGSDPVRPFA